MSIPPDPDRRLSEISHLFLSSVRDRHTMGRPSPRRTPPGTAGKPAGRPGDGSSDVWSPPGEIDPLAEALAGLTAVPPPAKTPTTAKSVDAVDVRAAAQADDLDTGDSQSETDADARAIDGERCRPLSAVVGPHLYGGLLDAARQYAGHRAAAGRRVGVIHLDAAPSPRADAAVRLVSVESDGEGRSMGDLDDVEPRNGDADNEAPRGDADALAEALVEMDADVDEWLMVVADPDAPRARRALSAAGRWVVPTTADHDGVVGAYRTIKSLLAPAPPPRDADAPAYDDAFLTPPGHGGAGVGLLDQSSGAPAVSLVVLDAMSAAHADRVHRKVAGACGQFLALDLIAEPPATFNAHAAELPVLSCGGGAGTDCWDALTDFVESGRDLDAGAFAEAIDPVAVTPDPAPESSEDRVSRERTERFADPEKVSLRPRLTETVYREIEHAEAEASHATNDADAEVAPVAARHTALPEKHMTPALSPAVAPVAPTAAPDSFRLPAPDADTGADTVLDLPAGASASCVISAVLAAPGSDLAACPVAPPVLPSGTVAVGRDGRLVLVAAVDGSASLPPTMAAFRWLAENRRLLAMALPQFRVDADLEPQLRLHVDHARRADLSAESLRPLLRDETVTVRTYRTLKWGGRTGLLLEAA